MNCRELLNRSSDLTWADYPQPVEKLISLKQAGDALSVPYFKILRAARAGLFPCYHVGNRRALVRLTEVVAAIERSSSSAGGCGQVPTFDPDNRFVPFEVAASNLQVPVELIREAANRSLFPSLVDASGLRVAKLSSIAAALVRMCELRTRTASDNSVGGGSNV